MTKVGERAARGEQRDFSLFARYTEKALALRLLRLYTVRYGRTDMIDRLLSELQLTPDEFVGGGAGNLAGVGGARQLGRRSAADVAPNLRGVVRGTPSSQVYTFACTRASRRKRRGVALTAGPQDCPVLMSKVKVMAAVALQPVVPGAPAPLGGRHTCWPSYGCRVC